MSRARNVLFDKAAALEASGAHPSEVIRLLKEEDSKFAVMTDRQVQTAAYGAMYYRRKRNGTILCKGPRLVPPLEASAAPKSAAPITHGDPVRWTSLDDAGKHLVLETYANFKTKGKTPTEARELMMEHFSGIVLPPVGILASLYARKYKVTSGAPAAVKARKQRKAVKARKNAKAAKAYKARMAAAVATKKPPAAEAPVVTEADKAVAPKAEPPRKTASDAADQGKKRNVTMWVRGVEVKLAGSADDLIKMQKQLWSD